MVLPLPSLHWRGINYKNLAAIYVKPVFDMLHAVLLRIVVAVYKLGYH